MRNAAIDSLYESLAVTDELIELAYDELREGGPPIELCGQITSLLDEAHEIQTAINTLTHAFNLEGHAEPRALGDFAHAFEPLQSAPVLAS